MIRSLLVYVCAAVMGFLTVKALYFRGGPYFDVPRTVFDHVAPGGYLSRDAILVGRSVEQIVPRGASLTVVNPEEAPRYDITLYLTASGVLPRHHVVPPSLDHDPLPDFVIALGKPLQHDRYRLVREFPEGRLYAVQR